MFCDQTCMTEGCKRYHGHECEIIDDVFEMQALVIKPESNIRNVTFAETFYFLRPVIESSNIAGSPYFLRDLMTPPKNEAAAEDFDIRKMNGETYEMKQLQIVNLLNAQNEDFDPNAKYVLAHYIDTLPMFDKIRRYEDVQKFFKEFSDRIIKTLNKNGVEYSCRKLNLGRGILPFCSLFNHSCDPNVHFVSFENKFAFVVVKPIAKDEQLFINYG
jgi:hypothetical protein